MDSSVSVHHRGTHRRVQQTLGQLSLTAQAAIPQHLGDRRQSPRGVPPLLGVGWRRSHRSGPGRHGSHQQEKRLLRGPFRITGQLLRWHPQNRRKRVSRRDGHEPHPQQVQKHEDHQLSPMEHLEVLLKAGEAALVEVEEGRFQQANLDHPLLPEILLRPEVHADRVEEPAEGGEGGDGAEAAGGQSQGHDAGRVIIYIAR